MGRLYRGGRLHTSLLVVSVDEIQTCDLVVLHGSPEVISFYKGFIFSIDWGLFYLSNTLLPVMFCLLAMDIQHSRSQNKLIGPHLCNICHCQVQHPEYLNIYEYFGPSNNYTKYVPKCCGNSYGLLIGAIAQKRKKTSSSSHISGAYGAYRWGCCCMVSRFRGKKWWNHW